MSQQVPLKVRFFRFIGREVYGAVLPIEQGMGAETYFEDLWRDGSWKVSCAHFVGAFIVFLCPLFVIGKVGFLSSLKQEDKDRVLSR